MKIITRKEAKQKGLKRYFTDKPCKYGHIAEKWVTGSTCLECAQSYYQNNKDRIKTKAAKYYEENKGQILQRNSVYWKKNQSEQLAKRKHKAAEWVWRRDQYVRDAKPKWANDEAIREIYAERDRLIEETGIPHHVDHDIALRGVDENGEHIVCGLHVEHNLRVVPAKTNLKKSNKFED